MQGAFKIQNDPLAMTVVTTREKLITLLATNTIQQLSLAGDAAAGDYFQKIWIYPASAVDAITGVLTPNGGDIHVGLSGSAGTRYLPEKRAAGDVDYPIVYELPLGQKMKLGQIIVVGTIADGVFIRFV